MPPDNEETRARPRILIVDDDPSFLDITRHVLERRDYVVETASGGEEAIAKIYNFEPEVMILDVLMPRLTGIETIKIVKGWRPQLQVIVVSAFRTITDDFTDNGAFAFLEKPVDPELLYKIVEKAIDQRENPIS